MTRIALSLVAAGTVALGMTLAGTAFAVTPEGTDEVRGPKVCNPGFAFSSKMDTCISFAGEIPLNCDAGTVYDVDTQTCVQLQAGLHDPQLYQQGTMLALAGEYQRALGVLNSVSVKDSAVLTMIGYATRKLGNLDEGIAIYHRALALDPGNLSTHEYLGEGYLDAGRIDLAEAQLDTLELLCGVDCPQYQTLSKVIAGEGLWN